MNELLNNDFAFILNMGKEEDNNLVKIELYDFNNNFILINGDNHKIKNEITFNFVKENLLKYSHTIDYLNDFKDNFPINFDSLLNKVIVKFNNNEYVFDGKLNNCIGKFFEEFLKHLLEIFAHEENASLPELEEYYKNYKFYDVEDVTEGELAELEEALPAYKDFFNVDIEPCAFAVGMLPILDAINDCIAENRGNFLERIFPLEKNEYYEIGQSIYEKITTMPMHTKTTYASLIQDVNKYDYQTLVDIIDYTEKMLKAQGIKINKLDASPSELIIDTPIEFYM